MTNRLIVALALVLGGAALADGSVDGEGQVTLLGGFRWVPNWYFEAQATSLGNAPVHPAIGGPAIDGSFALGVTDFALVAIDLFASWYPFELQGYQPFNSTTYGALIGAQLVKVDWPIERLRPYVGVQVGPTYCIVSSNSLPNPETLLMSVNASAGATWKLNDRYGVTFDVRYQYARIFLPGISGINTGGVWFTAGLTIFTGKTAKQEISPGI